MPSRADDAILLVAVNFDMETVAVSKPMPLRAGSGRQHRMSGFGRRSPESEPRNLQFVSGPAAVVDSIAVGYLDDGEGVVGGFQDNDIRPIDQTGTRLTWSLGFNPCRAGRDCPEVGVVAAGKANVRHFPSGLACYISSQELEQFVLEFAVRCVSLTVCGSSILPLISRP